ncbi:MAG: NAD(P)H-dependent oxidoreductase [Clostridia bacterium]|nr:NAD(P)H-dependent oxidoreductase [Clostridia bacterium]
MSLFGSNKENYKDKNSLIIYFSRADENYSVGYIEKGNTEHIAEYVQELTNADMFKVEPLVPYAKDYKTCIEEAKQRIGNAPIKEKIEDISEYEVIYIMTPIYWGTYAPELETALKELDFTGKIIRIVTTHEGSGLANVPNDVKRICKGAIVLDDSIAIRGADCLNAKSRIENWI